MLEYSPDHRLVFDTADDPYGALTFRTDQRIDLVDFLNQPSPTFPESLHITLRFKDTGHGVIKTFLLPFSP